jgi:hypothetical protein
MFNKAILRAIKPIIDDILARLSALEAASAKD